MGGDPGEPDTPEHGRCHTLLVGLVAYLTSSVYAIATVTPVTEGFRNIDAAVRSGEHVDFSFGENWGKYIRGLTPAKVAQAERSLQRSFAEHPLQGMTFLDIGCGSGLFSLGAVRAGASSVVSVDIDPDSVACAEALRRETPFAEWEIRRGSILDDKFLAALRPAARVYSWGVLHHTGAVWQALENVLTLVEPGGLVCVALYLEPRHPALQMGLKRAYNKTSWLLRPLLAAAYAAAWLGAHWLAGRGNPVRYVRDYGSRARGMSFWRDVEDWLGGLPCEFTTEDEVRGFLCDRGFIEEQVLRGPPGANSEYLFRRPS